MLRCVNHLEKITAGRIYVDGELIGYRKERRELYEISAKQTASAARRIGMVFNSSTYFTPHRAGEHYRSTGAGQRRVTTSAANAPANSASVVWPARSTTIRTTVRWAATACGYCPGRGNAAQTHACLMSRPPRWTPNSSAILRVMKQLAHDGMTMLVVTHEMGFAGRSPIPWPSWTRCGRRSRTAVASARQSTTGTHPELPARSCKAQRRRRLLARRDRHRHGVLASSRWLCESTRSSTRPARWRPAVRNLRCYAFCSLIQAPTWPPLLVVISATTPGMTDRSDDHRPHWDGHPAV